MRKQKPFFEKTSILGVGLLGASLALALREKNISGHITGFGRKKGNLAEAAKKGIIDSYSLSPSKAVTGADLVVFATPVGMFKHLAKAIKPSLKADSIQTDVGSVKGGLIYEMEAILPRYVGCHPIAGGERSGIEKASGSLFAGVRCIITPTGKSDPHAAGIILKLWESIGARVETMSPEEHDRVYALVSHLPHLVAYALVNTVGEADPSAIGFAGRGFRDATRIALSSPELWRDICGMNRENILRFLRLFKKNIRRLEESLKSSDTEGLEREFHSARKLRGGLEG